MNIQQLRIFLSVCTGSTLLETAERLGLKQPTVSFHLRKLEQELDVELWHKSGRGYRPNETALTLLPYARKVVALMNEAEERMSEIRNHDGGKLRIGASHTPATYLIPPYLAQFQRENPQKKILLTVKKASSILEMLTQYEIDAAVVSLPKGMAATGLFIHPLVEDELRLFLSPEHPLAGSDSITVEQLQDESFLLHEQGTTSRQLTDEWAERVGLAYNNIMEMGAIETIKSGLKCNMGVGVLPWRSAVRDTELGLLIQKTLPDYTNNRYICLVHRDEEFMTPQLYLFIQFIRNHITDTPAVESY